MGNNSRTDKSYDWAQNAENAAKKAEAEINRIKKEAQEEFNKNKPNLK
ncbi:hypothetical protein [Sporosarcina ureilytica]|nr:hypothetical protein [Sporosarcina ureilytica]